MTTPKIAPGEEAEGFTLETSGPVHDVVPQPRPKLKTVTLQPKRRLSVRLTATDQALPAQAAYEIEDHGDPLYGGVTRTINVGGAGGVQPMPQTSPVKTVNGVGPDGLGNVNLTITASAVGALAAANDLSDVPSPPTARTNLGLGSAATHPATDFLQGVNNLSEVASPATALSHLGGLAAANDLVDVADPATALANLGGLSAGKNLIDVANPAAAIANIGGLAKANNLSDLADVATARDNLGVAFIATPEQYGAVGNGTTNDSAAIQAALNSLSPGGICLLGPTSYNIATTTLSIPKYVTLAGYGQGVSQLGYTGTGTAIQMANPATSEQKFNVKMFDFTLNAASAAIGINVKGMTRGEIARVDVIGVNSSTAIPANTVGILFDGSYASNVGCWWNVVHHCYVTGWDTGIKMTGVVSNGQANENQVHCTRVSWTNKGVWVDVGDHNTIRECDLTSSASGSIGVYANDRGTRVEDCRFESTGTGVRVGASGWNCRVQGNDFSSSTAGSIGVQLDAGSWGCQGLADNDYANALTTKIVDNTANDSSGASLHWLGSKSNMIAVCFAKTALAASFSGNINLAGGTQTVFIPGRAYQIRGVTARLSGTKTAGNLTITPGVSGSPSTNLSAAVANSDSRAYNWQGMGHDTNSNGLSGVICQVVTDSGFLPSGTVDLFVTVWIEFTP